MILSAGAVEADVAPGRSRSGAAASGSNAASDATRVVTRLNSLIRPQPWVNWLLVAFGFFLLAGVVQCGWMVDRSGSGLQAILGLRSGRLCHLFASICLLAVTQLSLVILWYRTRSRKDFQGQYRIWIWSSLTWALFFSASVSGWHQSASHWMAGRMPGRLETLSDLIWLIPGAVAVGTTFRLLSREMRRMPLNRWLLRVAAGLACGELVLTFIPGLLPSSCGPEVTHVIGAIWPLLMASSLLHHARYVIHVSNEAAPQTSRPGRVSPIIKQVWSEVLSLGPSRASLARTLAPNRWVGLLRAAGQAGAIVLNASWRLIVRHSRQKQGPVTNSITRATRRAETTPLPVVSSAAEPRPKASGKGTAKTVKSA